MYRSPFQIRVKTILVFACFYTSVAFCQTDSSLTTKPKKHKSLTQDWHKLRGSLEAKGIVPHAVYTMLPIANVRGGFQKGTVWMDNVDLSLTLNLETLIKLKATTFFLYGLSNNGGLFTPYVGDLQVVSNIETATRWQVYEIWLQKNIASNKLSFLLGKYDLNAEFDLVRPAILFINSSFGIGADYSQSGVAGPSIFPYTSLSFRVAYRPLPRIKLQAVVADASPKYPSLPSQPGALIGAELMYFHMLEKVTIDQGALVRKSISRRNRMGRSSFDANTNHITLGMWSYSSSFLPLQGTKQGGAFQNSGIYVSGQQFFFVRNDRNYIAGFARAGFANSRYNRIGKTFTGGIVSANQLGSIRIKYGLAFSHVRNGIHFSELSRQSNIPITKSETAIETTIAFALPVLTLQPDIQFILNPGTNPGLSNAITIGILAEISL